MDGSWLSLHLIHPSGWHVVVCHVLTNSDSHKKTQKQTAITHRKPHPKIIRRDHPFQKAKMQQRQNVALPVQTTEVQIELSSS